MKNKGNNMKLFVQAISKFLLGVILVVWAMTHKKEHFSFPNKFADEDEHKKKK